MGVVALLCMVLLMVPVVDPTTPLKKDTACYRMQGGGPCSLHKLKCDTGKVFILQAVRGFKPSSSACAERPLICPARGICCQPEDGDCMRPPICPPARGICCQPEDGDCMEAYSASHFQQLYSQCWNKTSCNFSLLRNYSQSCGADFHNSSDYSQIEYVCLTDSSITDFYQGSPVLGSGVAVAYSDQDTGKNERLSCRVDSANCSRVSTNVLLYRGRSFSCEDAHPFTTVYLNTSQYFNCSWRSDFATVQNVSTPFTISLEIVSKARVCEAWVVVQGSDTDVLNLTCGYIGDTAADTALCPVLVEDPTTPLKKDTACYGIPGAGSCSLHNLTCDTGKVFIVQAVRGFKPSNSACAERTSSCPPDLGICCQAEDGDCMEAYSASHFQQLYSQCWNKTSCSYRVPQRYSQTCEADFHSSSGYSQIDYVCLTDYSITDFYQTTPVRGSGVAVAYSYSYRDREGRLSCRVHSASCSRVSTNVLLYRGPSLTCHGPPRFTTVYLNGDQVFNCSNFSNFAAVQNVSTPFTISLEFVPQITVSTAWVVVQGSDTDVLNLTCGYPGDTADTALCPESCPQLTESSPYGNFTWPETREGDTARLPCPNGTETSGFNATRQCSRLLLEVSWRSSCLHGCSLATKARRALRDIALQPINASNAMAVSRDLLNVTRDAAMFSRDDVSLAVYITLSLLQQPQVVESREQVVSMVTALDGLLGAPKEAVKSETGAKLLEAISLVGREASLSGGKLQIVQPRLALVAVPLPPSQSFPGLLLAASTPPNSSLDASKVWLSNSTSSSEATGREETSINLPSGLLKSLPADTNVTRITFAVFQNADLFTAIGEDSREGGSNDTRFISSPVVAAAVPGLHLQNLSSPVLISLPHHKLGVDAQCVFWQEALSGGHWSSQGCEVRETGDWHTLCACTHLTNFALLMDVYQTGGQLSQADMRALSIISMVGCVLSLLGLLLTLLTFCLFRNLRKDDPSKIHINLCVALALSDIIFVAGLQHYTFENPIACKAVAALLHLCLLSAMAWTSVEAFYLYLALVRVFNTYTHRFLLKCALVAWGVPFIIVVLTLGINKTNNYGLQNDSMCWLGGAAFYGAFAGPVLLLLLCNLVGFGLAIHRMRTATSAIKGKGATSDNHMSLGRQLRGAIGVLVLLGLTWIFAIFAIGGASVVFHYLFAIFNSLQGLFIFIFYCLLKKDARAQWRRLLSCSCARAMQYRISHSGFSTRFRRLTLQGTTSSSSGEDKDNKSADADARV